MPLTKTIKGIFVELIYQVKYISITFFEAKTNPTLIFDLHLM